MKIHKLKTWPGFFEDTKFGAKNFEVRKNDRNFSVNDILHLQEYNPKTEKYTGNDCFKIVTYILYGGDFGIEKDYCVLGIKNIEKTE